MSRPLLSRAALPRPPTYLSHCQRRPQSRFFSSSSTRLAQRRTPPPSSLKRSPSKPTKPSDLSASKDASYTSPLRRPLTTGERENQRWYFFYLLSGTLFFGVLSFYGFSYYKLVSTVSVPSKEQLDSLDLEGVWVKDEGTQAAEVRASNYDDEINGTEWFAGLYKIRQEMVNEANGDVLESAVGTGRNGEWYGKAVASRNAAVGKEGAVKPSQQQDLKSVTMVDVSEGMISVAREKWEKIMRMPAFIDGGGLSARFVVGDLASEDFSQVEKLFTRSGASDGNTEERKWPTRFDTVIQTNGLCSTKHPSTLLRNLAKLVKPDGKILLLEHGRSYYDLINNILDRTAVDHAKKHGCLWNRDIEELVKQSGLQIESIRRISFGTHYYIVLRPSDSSSRNT